MRINVGSGITGSMKISTVPPQTRPSFSVSSWVNSYLTRVARPLSMTWLAWRQTLGLDAAAAHRADEAAILADQHLGVVFAGSAPQAPDDGRQCARTSLAPETDNLLVDIHVHILRKWLGPSQETEAPRLPSGDIPEPGFASDGPLYRVSRTGVA